ncbi:MAG: hypothetical protein FD126_120 [Elusimicrobia bacterium]|nr:MAG: hypothetical protein FD126_120 [Elusimicrobiota bacterium]
MATKTRKRKPAGKAPSSITGRYVYDPKTDRLVKVSDRTPSVASSPSACGGGPCRRPGGCPR